MANQLGFTDVWKNLPLLLGGLFMVYLAAVDETLFNAILRSTVTDRLTVSLSTTVAAGIPMFFAVGLIKMSILPRFDTIYYYEKFLASVIFWVANIVLLITIAYLSVVESGIEPFTHPVKSASVIFALYLIIYMLRRYKKRTP